MPVRSFECKKCGFQWDELVSMNGFSQGSPDKCPDGVDSCSAKDKETINQMVTAPAAFRTAEYSMELVADNSKREKKKIDPLGTKFSTEHIFGYKPNEKSKLKADDIPEGFNMYTEWDKKVSELSKRQYDKKEERRKRQEECAKLQAKGATVGVMKTQTTSDKSATSKK